MSVQHAIAWGQRRSLDELDAAEAYKNLAAFTKRAWSEIDPEPLVWNWHMDAVCDHLEAVTRGDIQQLIINIPPGHSKSMLTSVMWPAWVWARKPEWKALFSSNEMGLVSRDMTKRRLLMESDWYRGWFRSTVTSPFAIKGWDFADDQNTKTYYRNTRLGEFTGVSVGQGTGKRGDCLVIDDPINADDADVSDVERENVIRWKTQTMSTRFNNPEKAQQVLIMQRLHEDDLTGYLLKVERNLWQHLCLMTRFEGERRSRTFDMKGRLFFEDPRKTEGELLFPKMYPETALKKLETGLNGLGRYGFAGQHQQRPTPAKGGILEREWFNNRWRLASQPEVPGLNCRLLPMQFDMYAMFTDAAFKKTTDSDLVAIGLWGLKGPDIFLLDLAWERMTFTDTLTALVDMRNKWTRPPHVFVSGVYVEDKANGSAIMDSLKATVPGIVPIEPDGGKEARIMASAPFWRAGNIWLPLHHKQMADYVTEAVAFPKASHDDAIDMTAYAARKLLGGFSKAMLDALGKL